jgi:hypothetical protein
MRILGFGKSDTESVSEFWSRTAEKRGGQIGLCTYANYLGRTQDQILELPGLLYTVGDMVWFEDFEKNNWLARLINVGSKYQKTELGFPRSEVDYTRVVSRGAALRCIRGSVDAKNTRPLLSAAKIFFTPVVQISFTAGHSLFFEVLRQKELLGFLK